MASKAQPEVLYVDDGDLGEAIRMSSRAVKCLDPRQTHKGVS